MKAVLLGYLAAIAAPTLFLAGLMFDSARRIVFPRRRESFVKTANNVAQFINDKDRCLALIAYSAAERAMLLEGLLREVLGEGASIPESPPYLLLLRNVQGGDFEAFWRQWRDVSASSVVCYNCGIWAHPHEGFIRAEDDRYRCLNCHENREVGTNGHHKV